MGEKVTWASGALPFPAGIEDFLSHELISSFLKTERLVEQWISF
jgi:hypothetical protein